MADILIRGMEMPTKCGLCPMFCDDFNDYCSAAQRSIPFDAEKPEWCPFVHLPEGHGRLIDADAVVKTICNSCDGACDVVQCDCLNCKADCRCDIVKEISDAPTIIEADLEWKMKNCCCFSNTDQAEGGGEMA